MGLFNRKKGEEPTVLDLRDEVEATAKTPMSKTPISEFGFPTRCPSCDSRGYLDHIDPFKRIQYEHCPNCWTKWEHSEEELLTASS